MEYAIETLNLSKKFTRYHSPLDPVSYLFGNRDEVLAIDKVTIRIAKGDLVGLVGANGAGKTTLLKILASLILLTSGEVFVNGSVGVVTGEERSFYWRLTGRQNLEFFAALYGLSFKEQEDKIRSLSKFLEIDGLLDVAFQKYSAGYKQRLSILRSLLRDPDIFLFDELTKSLDASFAERMRDFIKELVKERQKTVIFASHNKEEISYLTSNMAIMEKGRLKFASC